jgi:hypothetical protein
MAYRIRTFRDLRTNDVYEVAASEQYLQPLRRRIVQECGGDPEWENESVFQYQAGLDVEMPGEIDRPVVRIERPG